MAALWNYVSSLSTGIRLDAEAIKVLDSVSWTEFNQFKELSRFECDEVLAAMYRVIGAVHMYRVDKGLQIVGVMAKSISVG